MLKNIFGKLKCTNILKTQSFAQPGSKNDLSKNIDQKNFFQNKNDNGFERVFRDNEDEDDYEYRRRNFEGEDNFLKFGFFAAIAAIGLSVDQIGEFFFFKHKRKRNNIERRVYNAEYPANHPIEDRHLYTQLKSVDGFAVTVFDGHGGWQCSEWAKQSLHIFLDEELGKFGSKSPKEDEVQEAINKAFDRVEGEFKRVALEAYNLDYSTVCQTGSCCLCTVVIDNKLYVANIGDCGAVLLEKGKENNYTAIEMNVAQSAMNPAERERLRKKFPNDPDIVHQKRAGSAWYVKKRLMPTRAFGDLHLKHQEFNNPKNYPRSHGFKSRIDPWNGPYITHRPDIRVYTIEKEHKGYILASDGLWDEMTSKDVAMKFNENTSVGPNKFVKRLMKDALAHAALENKLSYENLLHIKQGRNRRNIHDDITILFVNLENQDGNED